MLDLKALINLAKKARVVGVLNSVVFDGRTACVRAGTDWAVGIACVQPITEPVVVPVETLRLHMNKGGDVIVHADHLTNKRGFVTKLNAGLKDKARMPDYRQMLDWLPKPPAGEPLEFGVQLDAVDRVLIASATTAEGGLRPYLCGVMFDLTDGVLVGSNGHRLHRYLNRVPRLCQDRVQLLLGRDPLAWMLKSVDVEMKVQVWRALEDAPEFLLSTSDTFAWVAKPLPGKFPDWERSVPALHTRPVLAKVDPVALADAAIALGKVTARPVPVKDGGPVRMCWDWKAGHLRAAEVVLPVAVDVSSTAVQWPVDGLADLSVWIEPAYLQDLADCVTPAATWSVDPANPALCPVVAVDGDFLGLVMPVRPEVATVANCPATVPTDPEPEPEEVAAEPCPAAVAAVVSQLMAGVAKDKKTAPKKPRLARKLGAVTA